MNDTWEMVKLGELLTQVAAPIAIEDDMVYKLVTVRMHNRGLALRQECLGREIKTKKLYRVREGQLVYSRIDARNGALGIIPHEPDDAVVSNDFPVFVINSQKIIPTFLNYFISTEIFISNCLSQSKGTSNRRRLKEVDFIEIKVPLPSLEDQRRIVGKINAIQQRINDIKTLQEKTDQRIGETIQSLISSISGDADLKPMKELAPMIRRSVKIEVDREYPELGIRSFGKGTFHKPAIRGDELNGKRLFRIEPGDLLFSNVFSWEGAVAVAQPGDIGLLTDSSAERLMKE